MPHARKPLTPLAVVRTPRPARSAVARWALAVVVAAGTSTFAQEPSGDDPRPLLRQLNRETRALYRHTQAGVLRVQLPAPRWVNDASAEENPLNKYKGLDPKVREQLQPPGAKRTEGEPVARGSGGAAAATRPADAEEHVDGNAESAIIVVPPPGQAQPRQRDEILGGRLEAEVNPVPAFAPNNIGLLLDDAGHVLVPLYVEREALGEEPVKLISTDGKMAEARYVGSDRQTNLTVLKMQAPAGVPVSLSRQRPAEGSLVMFVAPHDGSGRLGLWTGGGQDYGVVFDLDGQVAGVARYGQFLGGGACRLIAEQIIRHGSVKRATLGVIISEIRRNDPARRQFPALGLRTAMRVDQVMPGSAAERAGLQPGDLLLALAGESVGDVPSLAAAIAARSGETTLQVLRDERVIEIRVDLQQKYRANSYGEPPTFAPPPRESDAAPPARLHCLRTASALPTA